MKGVYKSVKRKDLQHKTHFDDWSDPLGYSTKNTIITKKKLTTSEGNERLNKLKSRTAYSQTEDESGAIRLKLKEGCPLITEKEIRSLRLPFHKGLVLNLEDDGYHMTCEYIKDLIVLDDMHNRHYTKKTPLQFNRPVLEKLADGLKLAEEARRKQNRTAEVEVFMNLGKHFRNLESSYYWLVLELMEQIADPLDDPNNPIDPKVEATARFVYGSFLLEIAHDLEEAKFHIQKSMQLSMGKNFWFINEEGKKCDILYLQSCVILSKIYLEEAYGWKDTDVHQAILSCRSSVIWAKQASNMHGIATALLTLVELYLTAGQLTSVLDLLQEYIKICQNQNFHRELCEGYVMLSVYYETAGENHKVIKVIEELISFAFDHGIIDIVMKGHIKLAEIYGKERIGNKMQYHAAAAYKKSKLVGSNEDIELSTCLLGIAQGDTVWNNYVHLMLSITDIDSNSLARLMDWKDLRIPFVSNVFNNMYQSEINENINIKHKFEHTKREELENNRVQRLENQKSFISLPSNESINAMRNTTKRITARTTFFQKSRGTLKTEQDRGSSTVNSNRITI